MQSPSQWLNRQVALSPGAIERMVRFRGTSQGLVLVPELMGGVIPSSERHVTFPQLDRLTSSCTRYVVGWGRPGGGTGGSGGVIGPGTGPGPGGAIKPGSGSRLVGSVIEALSPSVLVRCAWLIGTTRTYSTLPVSWLR